MDFDSNMTEDCDLFEIINNFRAENNDSQSISSEKPTVKLDGIPEQIRDETNGESNVILCSKLRQVFPNAQITHIEYTATDGEDFIPGVLQALGTFGDPPGMTNSQIDSCLSATVVNEEMKKNNLSCPVCLAHFYIGEKISKTIKCSHLFHENCVRARLSEGPLCPKCRHNLLLSYQLERNDCNLWPCNGPNSCKYC